MGVNQREPLLYVAVGKKGCGKTYNTTKLIDQYITGNIITGAKPRKALILDVNNEYTQYKMIAPDDIKKFVIHPKIEARRIVPYYRDGRVMSLTDLELVFKYALSYFRNGLIVAEDITKFVGDSISTEIVGNMCTNRHRDVDIIAHFQSIGKAGHPKIKANMNVLRYHKTLDTVERHKDKFAEYSEILKIAEKLINKKYDLYIKANREKLQTYFPFYVYVDFDRSQINGSFSGGEFREVITEFIQENEKQTIQPLMNLKDRTGKRIYPYGEALTKVENDIFDRYAPVSFIN
jgi:hypothetical protein